MIRNKITRGRFRKMPAGHETLERLQRWPQLRRRLLDCVFIYSREHMAFWREDGNGYVSPAPGGRHVRLAGAWSIDDALKLTRHCGPEKGIEFHSLF